MTVVEASIADLAAALAVGETTSVELVAAHLERIAAYDRSGPLLNAVPVLNPHAFAEAAASDARRAAGAALGPLDGIPYTAKDSYSVEGLPVSAGSPAFADLIARRDAFAIERLRAAGAVLIGLTTMPPLANGGMQRGLHGRAESPYDARYLPSAFASGSSNGSGVATAASFGVFGLAEETWSSGRAPASCNGLVAYTPSRGVISVRGNWPLTPTMDVVVPHTRSTDDLFVLLDVLVADDADPRGDFWREQPWLPVPAASAMRFTRDRDALAGRRLGVPRMYLGTDADIRTPIETRDSVLALWRDARARLEALGADVVEVDFPIVSNDEGDRPGAPAIATRGLVPPEFLERELWDLSITAIDGFLRRHGRRLADADPELLAPADPGALPDRYGAYDFDIREFVTRAREGTTPIPDIPRLAEGIAGLEATRRADLDGWMAAKGLDAVVFPAVADVGRADADRDEAAAAEAWRNGTWVANGNLVPRRFGLPTVTVPMGAMADTGMPVGLTFLGRPYDDPLLLALADAFTAGQPRPVPVRTPALPGEPAATSRSPEARGAPPRVELTVASTRRTDGLRVDVRGFVSSGVARIAVSVDGTPAAVAVDGEAFSARAVLPADAHTARHSPWLPPYGPLVVALAVDESGAVGGAYAEG